MSDYDYDALLIDKLQDRLADAKALAEAAEKRADEANAEVKRACDRNAANLIALAAAQQEIAELRAALRDTTFTPIPR